VVIKGLLRWNSWTDVVVETPACEQGPHHAERQTVPSDNGLSFYRVQFNTDWIRQNIALSFSLKLHSSKYCGVGKREMRGTVEANKQNRGNNLLWKIKWHWLAHWPWLLESVHFIHFKSEEKRIWVHNINGNGIHMINLHCVMHNYRSCYYPYLILTLPRIRCVCFTLTGFVCLFRSCRDNAVFVGQGHLLVRFKCVKCEGRLYYL